MVCNEIQEHFSDYFDGILSAPESDRIRAHLKQCETCRAEYQRFSVTVKSMRSLPEVPAPTDFVYKLRERISKSEAPWWRKAAKAFNQGLDALPLRTMTAMAAVVLALTVLVVYQGEHYPSSKLNIAHHRADDSMPSMLASSTDPVPVEFASTNPSYEHAPVYLDSPTEFLMKIIQNDPELRDYEVYPHHRGTGAIIQTPDNVIELEMDPAEFLIIQSFLEQGGQIPQTLREARAKYPIYVRVLPSPTKPIPTDH